MTPQLYLLRRAAIITDQGVLELPSRKTTALLAYLAYQGGWVKRSTLLYLLWSDSPEEKAQTNLRQLLHVIRQLPYTQRLEITKERLRWCIETDTAAFSRAYEAQVWEDAVTHYQGELLTGFYVPGILEFDNWLELERSQLAARWRHAALRLVEALMVTARQAEALTLLERLYQDDPLDEGCVRMYVTALRQQNRHNEAEHILAQVSYQDIAAFDTDASLSKQPAAELVQESEIALTVRPVSLPSSRTPFFGREAELETMQQLFNRPECRLVTLLGPGGIGKTRLALHYASQWRSSNVVFVPLEAVSSVHALAGSIANALNFRFFGEDSPEAQLLHHLKDKRYLIILDNLEHLPEAINLIADLLSEARQLRLLVTSRERLNLSTEWLIRLYGLACPKDAMQARETDAALALFITQAQKVNAAMLKQPDALPTIAQICQLVEGMPLALELLASWAHTLSLRHIASSLKQDAAILENGNQDLSARHQSMQRVIEGSWKQLSRKDRREFQRLQVFHGTFSFEALKAVIGMRPVTIRQLIDTSLLRLTEAGTYDLHPLILQFLRRKPCSNFSAVRAAHASYYLQPLQDAGLSQHKVWTFITENYANICAAWLWGVQYDPDRATGTVSFQLYQYHISQLQYEAMLELVDSALLTLVKTALALTGQLYLYRAGCLAIKGHDLFEVLAIAEQAKALLDPYEQTKEYLEVLHRLAGINKDLGQYTQARQISVEAVALAQETQHPRLSLLLMTLGHSEDCLGHFIEARAAYQQAMTLQKGHQGLFEQCYTRLNIAHTYYLEGHFEMALSWCQSGIVLCELSQNHHAQSYLELAQIRAHFGLGNFAAAEVLATALYKSDAAKHDRNLLADVTTELAKLATVRGDYAQAQQLFRVALKTSWHNREVRMTLEYLCWYIQFLSVRGEIQTAMSIARLIASHPQATWARRQQATSFIDTLRLQHQGSEHTDMQLEQVIELTQGISLYN